MTAARYLVGDVFDVLAGLEDGSVDLVLTSPPFLALRSYLPAGHPDKHREIGSEATPGGYIDVLLTLTEEWARVLAPHGSICVELGDTYSGSGQGPDDRREAGAINGGRRQPAAGWPLGKSLCLIPELYRISLVYGFNPLTGRTTPRWRARNVVRWCRPNPPVGALGDKVRPATSDMVVACKSARRFFDLDAVREPHRGDHKDGEAIGNSKAGENGYSGFGRNVKTRVHHPSGAPPLDHWWHDEYEQDAWLIPTEPYRGAHYATWPEALCVKPIEAMCPRKVCRTCGKPSERITVTEQGDTGRTTNGSKPRDRAESYAGTTYDKRTVSLTETLGWSDCGHDNWRTGVVLDPFAGSGTTLAVAVGHGRDAIGIDLDARNAELARQRCGMFVTVDAGVP